MTRKLWPVVRCLPAHSSRWPSHDQHGLSEPSTSVIAPWMASTASSAARTNSSVAFLMTGMAREIVACDTPHRSARTSSTMFCRTYGQATATASYKDSSFGRPTPLSHGSSSRLATRATSSCSCSSVKPVVRWQRNDLSRREEWHGNHLHIAGRVVALLDTLNYPTTF